MPRNTTKSLYRTVGDIIRSAAPSIRPPERISVSEAAEKYRYVNNPGSYVGPWDNDFAPYLTEPMDCMTSLDYTGVVMCMPVRSGKTDTFFNWLTHTVKTDPADMLVVQMTQTSARDWSQGDLRKAIRDTPVLREGVMPGKHNQNTHDVRFKSGMRILIKWPTITELSGKTVPRHFLMDYDRMPMDVDKEGTPFDLAARRGRSYRRYRMTVAESSPGFEVVDPRWIAKTRHQAPPTEGILSLYNRGDRRRWYWRCPHCQNAFEPDFELLQYPDSEDVEECAGGVYMACPHCFSENGAAIMPSMKFELNIGGRWVKDNQFWLPDGSIAGKPINTGTASFWLKGPAAAFAEWGELVKNYVLALRNYEETGEEKDLQTTVNTDQCKPYIPKSKSDQRLPEDLKSRAAELGEKVVPYGVRFLTAAVDIQGRDFVVQIHGHLAGDDTTVVDRFKIRISKRWNEEHQQFDWVKPHAYPEDWLLLIPHVIESTYPLVDESGRRMAIKATICDSGGTDGVTANAYEFWRTLRDDPEGRNYHRRFLLVKGGSSKHAPRVQLTYPDAERKDRRAAARGEVPVLQINTTLIKNTMDVRLDRTEPGGGMVMFPDWLPDWWYAELVAENKIKGEWKNPHRRRNESWDLLCYSHALCLSSIINIEHIDWENPPSWAANWDDNDLVFGENNNQEFVGKPKSAYNFGDLAKDLA